MNTRPDINFFTTASIEISDSSGLNFYPKDLHLLRDRLNKALEKVARNVLDEFGIVQENTHTVFVEPIEVNNDKDVEFIDES